MATSAAKLSSSFTLTTPSDREIVITRVFDAPSRLVFEAFTKPEHVRQWWGCSDSGLAVCEIDLRVGGSWRYVMRAPDGEDYGFHGVYREVAPPNRLVYTETFEMYPDSEAVVTLKFLEQNGMTTLTETILHPSVEARNGHLSSGMDQGAARSFDRLAELLGRMA